MAGHSKWANIRHRKGVQDARRGKVFSRLAKQIMTAVRAGGKDPDSNLDLRYCLDSARAANMPKDNIERAILKGAGELPGQQVEAVRFEGYGPGGAAVIVDCLTDNKVRTVADVRHAMAKHGGNMGTDGCVAFQFKHCGQIILEPGADEDKVMEVALEAGAEDVRPSGDQFEVITAPSDLAAVRAALETAGITMETAEVTQLPSIAVDMNEDTARQVLRLVDALEDLDDVQTVYGNFDMSDEVLEAVAG